MALISNVTHPCGHTFKKAYWRLNNFEQLPNRQADGEHGVPAVARFRAYSSEADFKGGAAALDLGTGILDMLVSFTPSSIAANMADEAYAAFKAQDFTIAPTEALASAEDALADANSKLQADTDTAAAASEALRQSTGDEGDVEWRKLRVAADDAVKAREATAAQVEYRADAVERVRASLEVAKERQKIIDGAIDA